MKTRFLILFLIGILVFSATPPSFAQTMDRVSYCTDIGASWDTEHRVCINVYDSEDCDVMGGSYVRGAGNEYKCPLDNYYCGGYASAPPVCVFSDSIKTKIPRDLPIMEKNSTSSPENLESETPHDGGTSMLNGSDFQLSTIIFAIVIGIGSFFGLMIFWRKRR